ncbi:MAG: PEP-utilizing enzyme [Acidimicrobiales bacterium]
MSEIQWPADSAASKRWPIYTRGNIGEVYPDVVLPLEWELGGLASELGWRQGAEVIGFATADDIGDEEFVVVGVFGGYAYFNVSLMRLLGVRTPGLGADLIDSQFLGDADVPGYTPQPGDKNLKATLQVIRTAVRTLRAKSVPLVDEMRMKADAYRATAPALDASDEELWLYIKDGLAGLWEYFIGSHVIVTMQATIAAGGLADLCEKRLGDPNLAVALTTGIGDVVSAEPAKEMWRLANETADDDYDEAFASFLKRHGHRGPNEFSLAGRDWAAYPEVAAAAINTMRGVDADRSPVEQSKRIAAERDRAVAGAKVKLGWRARSLDGAIARTALWSQAREESKNQVIRANQLSRHAFLELLRRAREKGGVEDRIGPMLLSEAEFLAYLADPPSLVPTIEQRRVDYEQLKDLEPPFAFDTSAYDGGPPPISGWTSRRTETDQAGSGTVLTGAAGAPGVATGTARVVLDPGDPSAMQPGDVLVAPLTDPSWTPLFVSAAAVVVEVGAAMSHSMIVSRELGIPCVVGVEDATLKIANGAQVTVDGISGTVTIS